MAAMAANDGEKIRSLFAGYASQAYGNGTRNQEEAFFRCLIATSSNANGVWRTLLTATETRFVGNKASNQSNG